MSGAPVVRDSDGVVVGLVSGRYNSADGWLTDNVWVARTEDMVPLLGQVSDIVVERVLAVREVVTTVLRVSSNSDTTAEPSTSGSSHALIGVGGAREAAWVAAKVLAALDDGARGIGDLTNVVHAMVAKAEGAGQHSSQEAQAFRRRMELRGLDPKLLIQRLPGHDEAVERWAEQISAANRPPENELPSAMLATYIAVLIEEISGILFSSLSVSCRVLLRDALTDERTAPLAVFLRALEEVLPTRRSVSQEVVLFRPIEADESDAMRPPPALTYRERGLQLAASQLCKLPDSDPYTRGREDLVARIVSAANKIMARDGAAACFLSGQPGIGASTVAVEVARRLAPAFEDGVWYVNLYGLIPGSRRDARTAIRLLAEAMALELGSGAMDDERMFGEFIAQLSQRRALIVLDNAADAAHVKPLGRPPAGCGIIVTSRNRLQDYASPGLAFGVGPLDHSAAIEVLKAFADEHAHDLAQLDTLAGLCDDVPLALRMIGARIAVQPLADLDYLVHLLSEEVNRLDYLEVGERAVRASIRLSYDDLDASSQRALRFITVIPGSMASGEELGHSLGEPAFKQEMLLSRLEDRNLVQHKVIKGYVTGSQLVTFSPFELVRLFARERLIAEESAKLISDFEKNAVDYLSENLRHIINHAHDAELSWELDPTRFHAALRKAEEHEWLELATGLALNLHVLYLSIHELDSAGEINDLLVGLHLRGGNYEEAVRALLRASELLGDLSASEQAVSTARRGRELALAHDLPLLAAEADFATSTLLHKLDDLPGALDASEHAAHAFIDLGHRVSAIPPVLNNCKLALELAQGDKAVFWGRQATDLADQAGSIVQQADAALNRGRSEAGIGNSIRAVDLSRRAGALYEHEEHWYNSAVALENGAIFSRSIGDAAGAAELLSSAADRWERVPEGKGRPHFVQCLIDLSSVQAEMSAFGQAQLTLHRAAEVITRWPGSVTATMRFEASVRRMAAKVFSEEEPHLEDENPAMYLPAEQKEEGAEQASPPDAELERIATIVRRINSGEISNSEAKDIVGRFLATPARTHAEEPSFWLHRKIDSSSRPRISLTPGRAADVPPLALD